MRPRADERPRVAAPALAALERWGEHSSAYLTLNEGTRHYASPAVPGVVAYRDCGRRHTFELCGPVAPAGERRELLRAFRAWTHARGRRLTALQLTRAEAELFAAEGFTVNQLGCSYSIALDDFTLRGSRFMRIRNKVSRARRTGVEVAEAPDDGDRAGELAAIDAHWLRSKGRLARPLRFMVGERGGPGAPRRRLFVARVGGRAVAYVSYSPVYGARAGWLYDLTRRHPSAPPGAIELIFVEAVERFRAEGGGWLHLGLTPFADLSDAAELPGASSRAVARAIREVASRDVLYATRTQLEFKRKWAPTLVEPEYLAYEGRPTPALALQLARLTGLVPL